MIKTRPKKETKLNNRVNKSMASSEQSVSKNYHMSWLTIALQILYKRIIKRHFLVKQLRSSSEVQTGSPRDSCYAKENKFLDVPEVGPSVGRSDDAASHRSTLSSICIPFVVIIVIFSIPQTKKLRKISQTKTIRTENNKNIENSSRSMKLNWNFIPFDSIPRSVQFALCIPSIHSFIHSLFPTGESSLSDWFSAHI